MLMCIAEAKKPAPASKDIWDTDEISPAEYYEDPSDTRVKPECVLVYHFVLMHNADMIYCLDRELGLKTFILGSTTV